MLVIVLPAPRYGKSSRGTPRLRRLVLPLQSALRLAVLTRKLNSRRFRSADSDEARLRSMSSFQFSIAATLAEDSILLPVAACGGFVMRLDRPALTPALTEIRPFALAK